MEPVGRFGDGVVELRDAVVAAADECEDLAGVGVEGDERDLRIGDGSGGLPLGSCAACGRCSSTFFMPASTASEAARCRSGSSEV